MCRHMAKYSINLLQAELIPVQPLWTLNRVAGVWGISLFIMLLWLIISSILLSSAVSKKNDLQRINTQNKAQLEKLELKVKNHKPDAKLVSRLANLKLVMANKTFLTKQLTDTSKTYVSGFSTAMTELSELHHKDISLHKVSIKQNQLVFSGVARSPSVVPSWLAGFERSQFLSGKRFVNFALSERDDSYTNFTVSSQNDVQEGN